MKCDRNGKIDKKVDKLLVHQNHLEVKDPHHHIALYFSSFFRIDSSFAIEVRNNSLVIEE